MIRYMSLEEQVDKDFERVRRRAFLRRMRAWLHNDVCSDFLPSFEEARSVLGGFIQVPRGIRTVPVEKIVGSVGRTRDFDKAFLPTRGSVATRWKRVDRAFYGDEELPPVRLFKVGDEYFVEDGNHRVSVARYQGVEMIDAEVVELLSRILRQNR
jgi:hypothetical protein